jgi:hypothetical protein
MKIELKADIKQLTKKLNKVQRKQIPFATAQAINEVAFKARKALMAQSKKKLDRPTPFTVKGFQVVKAKKTSLTAIVYVDSKRAKYMEFQIEGGIRTPNNMSIPIPIEKNMRLNKYGNMPRKKIKTLLAKPKIFSGKPRGEGKNANAAAGIWQRTNKNNKLKMLVSYEKFATYKPRFPFYKIVTKVVESTFEDTFKKHLSKAILTSR